MRPIFTLTILAVVGGIYYMPASAQSFTQKTGAVIGNQSVVSIPIGPGSGDQAQALIYYPDDYFLKANSGKRYPLYIFLHGAGEGSSMDIQEVDNTSLPQLIASGLKPYGSIPSRKTPSNSSSSARIAGIAEGTIHILSCNTRYLIY